MSRSGKTASLSQWAADRPRVLAWDPQQDWLKFGFDRAEGPSIAALCHTLTEVQGGPLRISYKGALTQAAFNHFARVAFAWGRIEPCLVIVEELAWVSNPGKAPQGWLELVTGGLKFGVDIASVTQRPAESDKTALSQSTIIRCFMQERHDDARYMAKELRIEQARIDALKPLEYIEKNKLTRKIVDGRVTF